MNGDTVGAIKPLVPTLAAGPRPRLRPALERAVLALAERLGTRVRVVGDQSIDLVWGRLSPLTVLRETRVQTSWRVAPTVIVQIDGRIVAPAAASQEPGSAAPTAPSSAPMRLATIERRLEMKIVERAVAALAASVRVPAPPESIPRSVTEPTAPPLRTAAAPRLVETRARPAEMVLAGGPSAPAPPAPGEVSRAPSAAEPFTSRSVVRSSPSGPEIRIDRITAEVIRALDSRVIAWRERTGRT